MSSHGLRLGLGLTTRYIMQGSVQSVTTQNHLHLEPRILRKP